MGASCRGPRQNVQEPLQSKTNASGAERRRSRVGDDSEQSAPGANMPHEGAELRVRGADSEHLPYMDRQPEHLVLLGGESPVRTRSLRQEGGDSRGIRGHSLPAVGARRSCSWESLDLASSTTRASRASPRAGRPRRPLNTGDERFVAAVSRVPPVSLELSVRNVSSTAGAAPRRPHRPRKTGDQRFVPAVSAVASSSESLELSVRNVSFI